jgi:hypothetical protein
MKLPPVRQSGQVRAGNGQRTKPARALSYRKIELQSPEKTISNVSQQERLRDVA